MPTLQVEQVTKLSACRVCNLQKVTTWSSQYQFSLQHSKRLLNEGYCYYNFQLSTTTSCFNRGKKSRSCGQVKHPVHLSPNTIPLGELLQLTVTASETDVIQEEKKQSAWKVNTSASITEILKRNTYVMLPTNTHYSFIKLNHTHRISLLYCCCCNTGGSRHSLTSIQSFRDYMQEE